MKFLKDGTKVVYNAFVNHIDCAMPWSTLEKEEGATRGMIRVRQATLSIDSNGIARATPG